MDQLGFSASARVRHTARPHVLLRFGALLVLTACGSHSAVTAPSEGGSPPPEDPLAKVAGLETMVEQQQKEIGRLTGELQKAKNASAASPLEYRIGPGDVLDISVWKNPELSRTVSVEPGGTISLPLLNQVPAAGLTPNELGTKLVQQLSEFIPNPVVSVLPKDVHSYAISVIGEASHPGHFELQRPTTVLEALALAGGLTQFASYRGIFVIRNEGGKSKRIPFDYGKATSDNAVEANFYLKAGDIVVIP